MANNNHLKDPFMDYLSEDDDEFETSFEDDYDEKTIFSSEEEDEPFDTPIPAKIARCSDESQPSSQAVNSETKHEGISSSFDYKRDEPGAEEDRLIPVSEEPITAVNSGEAHPSAQAVDSETKQRREGISKSVDYKRDEEDEPGSEDRPILVSEEPITVANSGEAQPLTVKSGTKRPCEATTSTDSDSKRAKMIGEVTKTPNSQRVWSDEDEIALLQGMIDFKTDSWRREGFYEAVQKSISFQVSLVQFKDKIRGLKRRYLRKEENNVESSLLKAHEKKCFTLSKLIWGRHEGNAVVKESDEIDVKPNSIESKPLFKRVWSDEDEIVILQAMVDFETDSWTKEGLYESVKKSISFEASKIQFKEKVRRLKERYLRKIKNVVEPSSLEPHEKRCFELSKLIWGLGESVKSERNTNTMEKVAVLKQELLSSPNSKKIEDDTKVSIQESDVESLIGVTEHDLFEENSFVIESFVRFGLNEKYLKRRLSKAPMEVKKRVEGKLKSLQAVEIECLRRKTDILRDLACSVLRADKIRM